MKLLNHQYFSKIYSLKSKILNFIYPNQCLLCEEIIDEDFTFCSSHYEKVKFIKDNICQICSRPIEKQGSCQGKCIDCQKKLPSYDSSTILFSYEENISKLILSFKYNDNTYICKKLGKLLAKKVKKEPQIIIPVPLHKKRLRNRKYNQSIILGKHVARNLKNAKFIPDLLVRSKFSKSQENLSESQRMENLKNAFKVNEKYQNLIKGKNIMVIDDVVTTGATLENCCKILKDSESNRVEIAAIAKTNLRG